MNQGKLTMKISLIAAALYIAVMGTGMYIMHYIMGYTYGGSEMVYVIIWAEIVLSIIAIFTVVKFSSWKEIGFGKMRLRHLFWLVPGVSIALLLLSYVYGAISINGINSSQLTLLIFVGITTLLVGFSEEVMFRGIVLRGALTKKGIYVSILISAIAFSLLHSVNILGGETTGEVIGQMVLTFIWGLFIAPVALKLRSLIPIIIFHFLWDFSLIAAPVVSVEPSILGIFLPVLEIIFIIILLILMRKESPESVKLLIN